MLYSAFFLTLAAVPAFSSPVFSSHQLISRGVKYPAGYADKQLWSDSLDRIKSYINVQSQDGAPLAMVDISILMTAQSNAEHVMEEVVTFMTTLTDDVVQGGGSHVDGSEWSENWNAGVSQYNRLSKNHIEDLATKQEQIWSDMESAKWSNVFAWIEKIFPSAQPQRPELNAPIAAFLRLTGGKATSHPTAADCKTIVDGWKSKNPEPEFFINLDTTYDAIWKAFWAVIDANTGNQNL